MPCYFHNSTLITTAEYEDYVSGCYALSHADLGHKIIFSCFSFRAYRKKMSGDVGREDIVEGVTEKHDLNKLHEILL